MPADRPRAPLRRLAPEGTLPVSSGSPRADEERRRADPHGATMVRAALVEPGEVGARPAAQSCSR